MSEEKLATVLNFEEKRLEKIEKKRRNFERVMFKNFLGSYSAILQDNSLFPVEIIDISQDGLLLQVPKEGISAREYGPNEEVHLRIYFAKDSYLPIIATVKHSQLSKENASYLRYGLEFDKSLSSFSAISSFVDFIYKFAEHSVSEKDDLKYMAF